MHTSAVDKSRILSSAYPLHRQAVGGLLCAALRRAALACLAAWRMRGAQCAGASFSFHSGPAGRGLRSAGLASLYFTSITLFPMPRERARALRVNTNIAARLCANRGGGAPSARRGEASTAANIPRMARPARCGAVRRGVAAGSVNITSLYYGTMTHLSSSRTYKVRPGRGSPASSVAERAAALHQLCARLILTN